MTNLLDLTVAAHGGLDRFNQLKTLSVHQRLGGRLWALKGQEGALDKARLTVDLHREHVSYVPFKLPNQHTDFTPERVAVETNEGEVVEERTNPRAAFAGHTQETPWDNLHLIYFASYAMWTYLTSPFTLTLDGVDVTEIEPWQEQGETWRRLKVKFPPYIATHSTEQTFYIGTDGLFRRHDYDVEISGNVTAAHYISEYKDVSGIMVPTKHRIYPRQQDNTPLLDLLLVSIDLSDIRFEATKLEANKELVRAYTRTVFNEHQTDRASEFLAPEVKWHGGTLGTVDGLANVAALLRGFVGALPDLTATEQDLVAEGDTVAVRYVVEATHKGDLMGIPATGRRVRWDAFDVYRVADGKIVEELTGKVIELEGRDLVVVELGHTDSDDTTCLHVPSVGLVVAGDAVYNDVHLYFAESKMTLNVFSLLILPPRSSSIGCLSCTQRDSIRALCGGAPHPFCPGLLANRCRLSESPAP